MICQQMTGKIVLEITAVVDNLDINLGALVDVNVSIKYPSI